MQWLREPSRQDWRFRTSIKGPETGISIAELLLCRIGACIAALPVVLGVVERVSRLIGPRSYLAVPVLSTGAAAEQLTQRIPDAARRRTLGGTITYRMNAAALAD